ncbi:uncharacterized protein LOC118746231 [Rhagoletis pomonella]|uniref:uncharacterized protein LOC118746231 n=1 Tax=Rhagoletis pomonella TaxID=28610 RepID=UPI001783EC7B|nr:uncharacterized protein LOC118746231 [Rhagoletis pomonella]
MVIQRSWKILSDAGSTSASSTEANRSPTGLQSSSDDSNCSNQTTHSMVTSVASPPVMKLEVQSAQTSVQQPPNPTFPVINSAISTNTSTASIDTMKYVTTPHMAETMLQRLRQRLSCPVQVSGTGATAESAMRSLELLRISIQQSFDHEIDVIIKQYMETYFKPAFQNIKENLGQNVVSEEILQKMSCALLENAKAQYNPYRSIKQPLACVSITAPNTIPQYTTSEATSLRFAVRRPPPKLADFNELPAKKLLTVSTQQQVQPVIPINVSSTVVSTGNAKANLGSTPTFLQQSQSLPQQNQQQKSGTVPASATSGRRQIFWNTAHISTTTKFVLDVQANQAFGFGTDGKERLASKHPELIRYLPDNEDRDWLSSQNVIAAQNRNSRFLFLIHEEVCRLKQTHETYRNKPNIDLNVMNTFTVPEFMIQKMKLFFVDLNIKSRGLITNSFSVGPGAQGNSHLRNALLQGIAAQNNRTNSNTGGSIKTTTPIANITTVSSADAAVTPLNKVNTNNAATAAAGSCNIATSSSDATPLTKPSTLSSSHATLTALLNNSSNPPPQDKTNIVAKLLSNELALQCWVI